jgi:hypothetical protein
MIDAVVKTLFLIGLISFCFGWIVLSNSGIKSDKDVGFGIVLTGAFYLVIALIFIVGAYFGKGV